MMNNTRVALLILVFLGACRSTDSTEMPELTGEQNRAYQLGKLSLLATAHDTEWFRPRPTVTSRMLGLIWTSVFDAWSRYDDKAIPVYLAKVDRRPKQERTLQNKEIAITYAAYRAMLTYFYSDSVLLRDRMKSYDLDPDDDSLDPTTPAGIGNLAAKTVIESRMKDGSNQDGMAEGANGKPYSDYTAYNPVNNPDELSDISRWQPKYFSDGKGGQFAPPCLTPQWGMVKPLMLKSPDQFRSMPPPAIGSDQLKKEVEEVVQLQSNLTAEQKALVEFMRDGPASVQQAGHWLVFAQNVSVRDHHTLDEDVKMYFLTEATAMDAFIACWDTKMFYDFARPYALVHNYYQNIAIKAWAGPERGWTEIKGEEWRPYSPDTFLCPPFPSYVSGHSTISGACAEVLRLFTGDDNFGEEVKMVPGLYTEPNNLADSVVIRFPTFTETANMAGISRVMGGYHIQADNLEGLKLGRNVAGAVWEKYQEHIGASPIK